MDIIIDHDQRYFVIGSIVIVIVKVSSSHKGSGSLEFGTTAKISR